MDINEPYPIEVTKNIDAFLDRIEHVLIERRTPRAERISVCAEVESQIHTMLERRIAAGAEISEDLVIGIIESMDPPESYGASVESSEPVEASVHGNKTATQTRFKPQFEFVRKLLDRPRRTTPTLDWVAVCGLGLSCLGGLFAFAGANPRGEGIFVLGLMMMLAGLATSGVSAWRIRHSGGLLTGLRIASFGMLMLPFLVANSFLCAILLATRMGIVLGGVMVAAALLYANYRLFRAALAWLASYSLVATKNETMSSDAISKPDSDSGLVPSTTF